MLFCCRILAAAKDSTLREAPVPTPARMARRCACEITRDDDVARMRCFEARRRVV